MFYDEVIHFKTKKVWDELTKDDEFQLVRKKFKRDFYDTYNKGFDYYIRGEWEKAKEYFELVQEKLGELDGPTKHLLSFMRESNFKSTEWHGYKSDSGH